MIEGMDGLKVVAEAPCGVLAIEAIESIAADLIILDLSLPRLSGMDVLRSTKDKTKAKFLIASMYVGDEVIKEAIELGANGFFAKDAGKSAFEKAVRETLNGGKPVQTNG
jgi:NarL family two-component system response regulator YdfI